MLVSILLLAAAVAQEVPPVPGLCSAPVPANRDAPGCYQTGVIDLAGAPAELYWHIHAYPTVQAADAEAARHRWSSVTQAHSMTWLYVLGTASDRIAGGSRHATIGPLSVPADATAHFAEAVFPPGMQTRVHEHPGPEAFYVVDGEQCMESPTDRRLIPAGGTYIVERGPHLQAALKGRRNLVLILVPKGRPTIVPGGGGWQPTGFCQQ